MTDTPDPESTRARAETTVASLSREERIRLVSGRDFWTTEEFPGHLESIMLTDGPHGLRRQVGDSDHVGLSDSLPATCFPTASALACTWDLELLEQVGAALGREARAADVAVLLGPGLNLKRHPRGGRAFEYFSEDPYLSGQLAAAMIRGIQAQGVAACPKHFAANNQETGRMVLDTIVDERTLRELYLRGFEIAVAQGRPRVLMTAYNLVNGQYASDSTHLLGEVLRDQWGYDGLVVSDWGGTNDHVAGLALGMDLEMPGGSGAFDPEIAAALGSGALDEVALDRSAARVAALALGWAETRAEFDDARIDVAEHHALARRAVAAGSVLLTNDGLLPLPAQGTIALIGAFAEVPRYQGAGSSKVNPTRVDALHEQLVAALGDRAAVSYAPGYEPHTGATTPALMAQASAAARAADRVVLVLGLPGALETEGRDRDDCRLPESMVHLAEVVLDANPRTAVVLMNGGPVELPFAHRAGALLEAYLGGQAGGAALADVLLGQVEPGGRLAESFPVTLADLPAERNFPGAPRQVEYRETFHVGYRFHDTAGVPAHFPFGHGLGYTTFTFDPPAVSGADTDLVVSVPVTNTGARAGSTVVQVYLAAKGSRLRRPAKELVGFARVRLDAGRSGLASIALDRRSFTVWDVAAADWLVEAGRYEVLVGASSVDIRGRVTVEVDSPDQVTPGPSVAGAVATDAEFALLLGHRVPVPRGPRPLDRTSTLADVSTTLDGRVLARLLTTAMSRRVDVAAEDDPADMLATVIAEMPLRTFVQMSGGRLSFGLLDRVIAALNLDPRGVLRPRR
ncbi:MAG: glycoside hydrolase family 3 C-terminal domain-containing protein [Candidatus Nanopelagicales bacterium]